MKLTNEGEGYNFKRLTLATSQIVKSQFSLKKVTKLQYVANFFFRVKCYLMYLIMIIMFRRKLCSKSNFIVVFPILANFAAFLDHTKENSRVYTDDGKFCVNFMFSQSTCLRLLAHQMWLLYLLPVRYGGCFAPNQNRTCEIAQQLYG